jgi:hypothetical protein
MNLSQLKQLRQVQDPLADDLVAKIINENGIDAVNHLFSTLTRNYEIKAELFKGTIGKQVEDYLDQTRPMPSWANPDKIKTGQRLFATYGGFIAMILNFRSLPMTYACKSGSKVLYDTGLLAAKGGEPDLVRRLMETAQFVIYVMEPKGLDPMGRGVLTAQKVRLIHGCIRHYLHQANFDTATYGMPINQEDMLGTLLAFGALVMEGLEMSGFKFSDDEKDAFIHTWNVISHWMGNDPQYLPDNYQDALTLGYQIFDSEKAPSDWGVKLADALQGYLKEMMGDEFSGLISEFLRFYIPKDTADMLQIPRVGCIGQFLFRSVLKILSRGYEGIEENHPMLRKLTSRMTIKFLDSLSKKYNDNKQIQFYLPSYLTEGADALYKENGGG